MNKPEISINTYHEYMVEAFEALREGLTKLAEAKGQEENDRVTNWLIESSGMQCRYAFLVAANALEAAANALLLGLGKTQSLSADLEKLPTLLKFEIFCLAHGKELDRGNVMYARVKDVVTCRNEFVHPKPQKVSGELIKDGMDVELQVSKTKARQFPTSYSVLEPKHVCEAVGDILAFVSWVVFDLCCIQQQEGVLLVGCESYQSSGSVSQIGSEYDFDLRTFNDNTRLTKL